METRRLPNEPDVIAPDGSEIRLLSVALDRGSMVHCRLKPGAVTRPVRHRTVEEMWTVFSGRGRIWRDGEITVLEPGIAVSITVGTAFQFRNDGDTPLDVVIATMPPWPGDSEAQPADGPWQPTV